MGKTPLAPVKSLSQCLARIHTDILNPVFDGTIMAKKRGLIGSRTARAPAHGELADSGVHVFVDDQNLFWGITNDKYGKDYRLDFGRLLLRL